MWQKWHTHAKATHGYQNIEGGKTANQQATEHVIRDLVDLVVQYVGYKGKVIFDTEKPEGQFRKPADNSKLLSYLPDFKFTSVEDGLRETVEWFLNNYEEARK